jgi:tetratricopeptide (TPR) repeat protein
MFFAVSSYGQKFKVSDVEYKLENNIPDSTRDIKDLVDVIEAAKAHPKTSNDPKMWFFRGRVYLIAFQVPAFNAMYPDALNKAMESFMKALETDSKDKYTEEIKSYYMLNVAIGKFNAGVNAFENENWDNAIKSFDDVAKILKLDEDEQLKQYNITNEKVTQFKYYTAQRKGDLNLAKKLIQKLIDDKFYSPTIYVDMARVCLEDKDTAAALEYIAKGKEIFESN